jgi:hypothetical protein
VKAGVTSLGHTFRGKLVTIDGLSPTHPDLWHVQSGLFPLALNQQGIPIQSQFGQRGSEGVQIPQLKRAVSGCGNRQRFLPFATHDR